MESLIKIINKLQDVFATVGKRDADIGLPQIVVVGSQSSGKSSVLEGIVGRDFLPRGSGIVTRRPLILQLISCANDLAMSHTDGGFVDAYDNHDGYGDDYVTTEMKEYAQFGTDDKKYFCFDEVREMIELETDRITGKNKGISNQPISLKVYSSKVVNLTLVDLPGLTKVPVGDQPDDIEIQIRDMILQYISNENSIILAVTPANQDFATSEALKMAREVDPEGRRTLAVLTKLDLMDKGTDAMEVLNGRVISVKLGIIGVVNRSQQDIIDKKDVKDALKYEHTWLRDNYYSVSTRNGTPFLAKRLSELLVHHIHDCLPQLRDRVSEKKELAAKELISYGQPVVDKRGLFLDMIKHFSASFRNDIEGKDLDEKGDEMCGGARIYRAFQKFDRSLEGIDAMDGLSQTDVIIALRNGAGLCPPLLVPEISFETLVRRRIKCLEAPSLTLVELVHEELRQIAQMICSVHGEWDRFPRMRSRVNEVFRNFLKSPHQNAVHHVKNLIESELSYINTNHTEFDKSMLHSLLKDSAADSDKFAWTKLSNKQGVVNSDDWSLKVDSDLGITPREERDYRVVVALIKSYFKIARKNIQDCVPKGIVLFLINYVMDKVHNELINRLFNDKTIDDLLEEDRYVAEQRKACEEMLTALEKAIDIIGEIRGITY